MSVNNDNTQSPWRWEKQNLVQKAATIVTLVAGVVIAFGVLWLIWNICAAGSPTDSVSTFTWLVNGSVLGGGVFVLTVAGIIIHCAAKPVPPPPPIN